MDQIIIFCAKYVVVFVVLGMGVAWLRSPRSVRLPFALSVLLGGIIALVISRIAGKLYFDPRPFVTEHVKPLFSHAPDNGFPSDHALFTMTLTAVTYFFSKKWATIMLLLTIVVGAARVLAKVHSPLDIAGGWVIGIAGAIAGYYLAAWLLRRFGKPAGSASNPNQLPS